MTAFYVGGLCYATPAAALPAFVSQYPVFDASFITYLMTGSTPTISATGLISINLSRKNFSSNTVTNYANTVQLATCLSPDVPYDYATGGAFWAFGFTGVMIMYFSSHLIGLVLKAVRRY